MYRQWPEAKQEPLSVNESDALPECEESTTAELQEILEREKDDFINFEQYIKSCEKLSALKMISR